MRVDVSPHSPVASMASAGEAPVLSVVVGVAAESAVDRVPVRIGESACFTIRIRTIQLFQMIRYFALNRRGQNSICTVRKHYGQNSTDTLDLRSWLRFPAVFRLPVSRFSRL